MDILGVFKIVAGIICFSLMATISLGYNRMENIKYCLENNRDLAFTREEVLRENNEVTDFGIINPLVEKPSNITKSYISAFDNHQLIKMRGYSTNLYHCEEDTKKPVDVAEMSLQKQRKYIKSVVKGENYPFNLCITSNKKQESVILYSNPYIKSCRDTKKTDLLRNLEDSNMFEIERFKWMAPVINQKDLIELSVLIVNLDKSHSSTMKALEMLPEASICKKDPGTGSSLGMDHTNPKRTFASLPFMNTAGDTINIVRFREILSSVPSPNTNHGMIFLKEHLTNSLAYSQLYSSIIWETAPIDNYNQAEDEALSIKRISLERSIHGRIDDLKNNPLRIKEYIGLVEQTISLEADFINRLIENSAYLMLRSTITSLILEIQPNALFPSGSTVKDCKNILNSLVKSSKERWFSMVEPTKAILDMQTSFTGKDKMLSFHPTTFQPSNILVDYISSIVWERVCNIEKKDYINRKETQRLNTFVNQLFKYKEEYYEKNWGHKMNNLLKNIHDDDLVKRFKEDESTRKQRIMVLSKIVMNHIIKTEMDIMDMHLFQLYALSKDIEMLNTEMMTLSEYKSCFSNISKNPIIYDEIANNLLNKLQVRKELHLGYLDIILARERMYKTTGATLNPFIINPYDLVRNNLTSLSEKEVTKVKEHVLHHLPMILPKPNTPEENILLSANKYTICKKVFYKGKVKFTEVYNELLEKRKNLNTEAY